MLAPGLLDPRDIRRSNQRQARAGLLASIGAGPTWLGSWLLFATAEWMPGFGIRDDLRVLLLSLLTLPVLPFTILGVFHLIAPERGLPRCPACGCRRRGDARIMGLSGRCPACTAVVVAGVRPRRIAAVHRWQRLRRRRVALRALGVVSALFAAPSIAIWAGDPAWVPAALIGGFLIGPPAAWAWCRTGDGRLAVPAIVGFGSIASVTIHLILHWP